MNVSSFSSNIDVAQITLYLFWLFFAGLLVYLRREDKREGYPIENADADSYSLRDGFPGQPKPKTFLLPHGGTRELPAHWVPAENRQPLKAAPTAKWVGAPLAPIGDPLLAGVGPGSWANRPDHPDMTVEGHERIVPLRADPGFSLDSRDPDPRGKKVWGADGRNAGTVTDIWVDRAEHIFRYLEVQVGAGQRVLLPVNFTKVSGAGEVHVHSLLADQFANVPALQKPDSVTMLEEEKIVAYYGAGTLYAKESRLGPVL